MSSDYLDKDDEIDVLELIGLLWSQKKTVFKFVFVFVLIGVFIAVFSKDEYESSVTLVPQVAKSNKMQGLGSLAAMAGINIGSSGGNNDISPKLYSKIINSVPFKRALLETFIKVNGVSKSISFKDYYENYNDLGLLYYIKKYTIGLPGVLLGAIKGSEKIVNENVNEVDDGIYRVSRSENILFSYVDKGLSLDVNDKDGILKIIFRMPESYASAQMVKASQKLLQESITAFKTKKIKSDYDFIEQTYKDAKEDFIKKQFVLANYRDRNQRLILSRSKSRLDRLEADYNLSYTIYSELAKEMSSQKIVFKKNIPTFTVLTPVSVPLEKSKPKRLMIIIIWSFLGGVLGVVVVLGRDFLKKINKR